MTSLRRYIPLAAVGILLSLGLFVSGCDSNAPTDDGKLVQSEDLNVAERIDVQDNLGTLKSALEDAGLLDSLRNEDTQFTVFAPSLGDVNQEALKNLNVFNEVVQYHVIAGQALSSGDLSGSYETLSGDQIEVTTSEGSVLINGAPVVEADLPATNGVVHRIGRTLLENQSVRTRLAVTGETQTYNQAIVANENDSPNQRVDYSQDGITVFAPNENAWIEWDTGGSNPFFDSGFFERGFPPIAEILQYHMVDEELSASDLTSIANGRGAVETMTGDSLDVSTTEDGVVTIDDARVTTPNLESTNGVLHILSARPSPSFYSVLGGPVDILEGVPVRNVMTAGGRIYNSLFTINASIGANYSSAPLFNPNASVTAIIPTNGAFSAANFNTDNLLNAFSGDNTYIPASVSQVAAQKLIDGHIITGSSLSADELVTQVNNANGSATYSTQLPGNSLRLETFGSNSDSLRVNGSLDITTTDLEVNNGVIHYINGGLIQTQLTVPERVLFSSPLSTLADAVYETGRNGVLAGSGRTLFAPSNDAFAGLPEGVPRTLLRKESALLGKILDYHALTTSLSSEDLENASEGDTYTTALGQDITLTSVEPPIEIQGNGNANPVAVQPADSASNGFVHPIGGLLLPDPTQAFNVVESTILNGYLQLRTALEVTNNRGTVETDDGLTVIAPSDGAFQDFLDNTGASDLRSLTPGEEGDLDNRLLMHVATRELSAEDIQAQLTGPGDVFTVETLLSQVNGPVFQLAFSISGGNIVVRPLGADQEDAVPIAQPDIQAENGTAHGIETVLSLP